MFENLSAALAAAGATMAQVVKLTVYLTACGFDDGLPGRLTSARRSKVTFEIEPAGQVVKLTVVHDDLDPGSTVGQMVSEGWPQVMSELKTLLETGETLAIH